MESNVGSHRTSIWKIVADYLAYSSVSQRIFVITLIDLQLIKYGKEGRPKLSHPIWASKLLVQEITDEVFQREPKQPLS